MTKLTEAITQVRHLGLRGRDNTSDFNSDLFKISDSGSLT